MNRVIPEVLLAASAHIFLNSQDLELSFRDPSSFQQTPNGKTGTHSSSGRTGFRKVTQAQPGVTPSQPPGIMGKTVHCSLPAFSVRSA